MSNALIGLYLGHAIFMLGLYLIADEILAPKIAKYVRMTAVLSFLWSGLFCMCSSILQM